MVQFNILSGKKAGGQTTVRRFPFSIGRAAANSLTLDDEGVWDQHVTIEFKRREGYFLTKAANAVAAVNDQPFENVRLRNGDVIALGTAKLQFWLAVVPQKGLRLREALIWITIFAVSVLQLILLYWLAL